MYLAGVEIGENRNELLRRKPVLGAICLDGHRPQWRGDAWYSPRERCCDLASSQKAELVKRYSFRWICPVDVPVQEGDMEPGPVARVSRVMLLIEDGLELTPRPPKDCE